MPKATPTEDRCNRITAAPGTEGYNRQFRRQALQAADAGLALWTVRIPCGAFALSMVAFLVIGWLDASLANFQGLATTFYHSLFAVEFGNVALRGKSLYFRYMLSGVKQKQAELDDRDDAK